MITTTIEPRFCETDAYGHIGNVSFAIWIEQSRASVLNAYPRIWDWKLILVKLEIDYRAETFFGTDVSLTTSVGTIGNSSFSMHTKIYQNDQLVAEGKSVLVKYDFETKKSQPFDDEQRTYLEAISEQP